MPADTAGDMAKILVVDDDPAIRNLMAVTLKLVGHDVLEAAGGEEALGVLSKQNVDLVVLDIMMPVTDGYEVLQRLRAMSGKANLPVIVVTAKGFDPDGLLREAASGAVDHLSKPFDPQDLERAVARVLDADDTDLERRRRSHSRGAEVFAAISELRATEESSEGGPPRAGWRRR